MNLQYTIMTIANGGRDISHILAEIPEAIVVKDYRRDAMANFLNALIVTDEPCVHMEDDIELCNGFRKKIEAAIAEHPNEVINFFSLRSKDYELRRPYKENGAKYLMNQCFYLPAGYGRKIYEFYKEWPGKAENPTGLDNLVADWMKANKLHYIQWFPHLVNHLEGKSLINPKRSSRRLDKNFTKDI